MFIFSLNKCNQVVTNVKRELAPRSETGFWPLLLLILLDCCGLSSRYLCLYFKSKITTAHLPHYIPSAIKYICSQFTIIQRWCCKQCVWEEDAAELDGNNETDTEINGQH